MKGLLVAPAGTVTVNDVAVAAVTVAFAAPKYTILFAAVVLKLVPVIVTDVPIVPEAGENEVMVGGAMIAKRDFANDETLSSEINRTSI